MIARLLIANRGEIACRIARTCRRLGIETVAVHSDADGDAVHVRACDHAVRLPGDAPADTYLRIDLLLDAARTAGADAVHPGYGFLAESAEFAAAVIDAGLTWVGPPAAAIAAMGSKVRAKELMRAAGVPTLPEGDDAGFPSLVKASAGGGGRGMRIVRRPDELDDAVAAAQREALAAFGDDEVFRERYVERGRHIEIQVLADAHGEVVALHERECSIQRRHQKIVEEAPSPVMTPALRSAMTTAAVDAARAVGYTNAGTVEFLVDGDEFWFLEMNTRLQVEHPVTELVTGLDLVELQLRIAEGEPLPDAARDAGIDGHAIEVRLTAEDPAAGYLPAAGTLVAFDIDGDVRVDSGVESGSVVSPYYDSMIAKVIAHGPTRAAAARTLRRALRRARIAGVSTNREQLVNILGDSAFLAGDLHTGFLDEHDLTAAVPGDRALALAAVWHGELAGATAAAAWPAGVPAQWRNNPAVAPTLDVVGADGELESVPVSDFDAVRLRPVELDGVRATVTLERNGLATTLAVTSVGDQRLVDSDDGQVVVTLAPRLAAPGAAQRHGSLEAPMPGSVRRLAVGVGDAVSVGQALVVLEAMKMEHVVSAPADGTVVEILVAEGTQVTTGTPLLVVD